MRSTLVSMTVFLLLGLFAYGCEDAASTSDLKDARELLKAKKADEALVKFQAVLADEPDNFHALFGSAEAHKQKQRWDEQEKILKKIMENETHMQERGQMLEKELLGNYLSQAAINKTKDPAKSEAMYRKIIAVDTKNKKANRALVDMFWDRGVKAQKAEKYEDAADAFEQASAFRMSKKRKGEIAGRMKMVKFFIERELLIKRLAKVEPDLIKEGKYNPKSKRFVLNVSVKIAGSPKGENDKEFDEKASAAANYELTKALDSIVWRVSGVTRDPLAQSLKFEEKHLKGLKQTGENLGLVKENAGYVYKLLVEVPRDAVLKKVITIDEGSYGKMTAMEKRFSKLEGEFAKNGQYDAASQRFIVRILLDAKAKRKEDPKEVQPRVKKEANDQIIQQFNDMMWKIAGKKAPANAALTTFGPDEIAYSDDTKENWGFIEIPGKRKTSRVLYRKAAMVKQSVLLDYAAEK